MNFAKKLRHKKPREQSGPTTREVAPVVVSEQTGSDPTAGDVVVKSAARPTVLHTFRHAAELNDVALSPDASHVAVAADAVSAPTNDPSIASDASVLVYEVATKALRSFVPAHRSSVQAVGLTRDAAFGVSADFAGVTLVWDASTGARRATLLGHRRTVTDVTILPHGNTVISTGIDGTVRIWDVNTEACVRNLPNNVSIVAAGVSVDGNLITCACTDSTVRLWDARVSKQLQNPLAHDGPLTDCAITPDASVLVSTTESGVLTLWDVGNRRVISSQKPGSKLFGCAITSDASRILATGGRGFVSYSDVSFMDTDSSASKVILEAHDNASRVCRCAINHDGTVAVTVGYDHMACLHSIPRVDRDALPGLHAVAISPMANMTETESVFFAYINDGVSLQAAVVARAIDIDFNMKAVTRLSTVYVAHLCVRTLLGNGVTFSDDVLGGRAERSSFFYRKLYHKLSELVQSQRSYDFAVKILHDARENNILSSHDMNSILGDALSNEYTRDLFSQLSTIMSQVYGEVSSRISSMEVRVEGIRDKVEDLKIHLHEMNLKKAREAKVQRYASLVKFGLSLVPIFGSAAMAFVESGVNIVMSLDLESLSSFGFEMFSTTTQFAIDHELLRRRSKKIADDVERIAGNFWAMEIAQHVLSEGFLKRLPEHDRRDLEKGLEVVFGRPVTLLKKSVDAIASEYYEEVVSKSGSTPPSENPLVDNTEQENVASRRDVDQVAKFDDSSLSDLFGEWSKSKDALSLGQACSGLMHLVEQKHGALEKGLSEAVGSFLPAVFLDATRENIYSLVNESTFVMVGRNVGFYLRQLISMEWSVHFDRASAGDNVIFGTVAKRLIVGVVTLHSNLLSDQAPITDLEQEIADQLEDYDEVNRFNFVRLAALITLRRQHRLQQQHKHIQI